MPRSALALVIAVLMVSASWYWLGRPVEVAEPDVAGPLACLSYTPFRDGESPFDGEMPALRDAARLAEDLQLLSTHTSCIRVYASVGMELIPPLAQKYGMQVLMGAWVSSDTLATRQEIEALVRIANAYPETIRGVLVGNEALLRREITPGALVALIEEVKQRVPQPVSYADVWEFHLSNPQVAAASEFVTIHILPYWEDEPVAIDAAVAHVRAIRHHVAGRMPGKPILIGETGWPSAGRMREGALPSRVNAARFVRGFVAAAHAEGWDYNLIEAFDQPWKRQLEGAVGGYWGLFDTARQDKQLLRGAISNHPYRLLAALAVILAALPLLFLRLPPRLAPLVAMVAVGWTLQLEQLWLIVRNGAEVLAAGVMLGVLLAVAGAALARLAGRPWPARMEAPLLLLPGCMAAMVSLWLVFDPRYRDFFHAGFLPLAVLLTLPAMHRAAVVRCGAEEGLIGALLCLSAAFIALNETAHNHQALAWSLASLLLGGVLLRRGVLASVGAGGLLRGQ
ncbi:MAG: beta (1-6) glucans synthase [Pseudomonadota bacterium]